MIVFMFIFLSVYLTCLAIAASQQQEEAPYVANFNYTANIQAKPGSAGVTFAVGNLKYTSNNKKPWFSFPQFINLYKAIKDDLSEILIAKGFNVRGPFDSYDLIPYSDKKAIDMYIVTTMELSTTLKPEKTAEYCTGTVEGKARIILELREVMTRELMWHKNIPFKEFEFPYNIRHPDITKPYDLTPHIMNDLAKGLEKQYPDLMGTISQLIDPEEMRIIKKQCQELKSKKGY